MNSSTDKASVIFFPQLLALNYCFRSEISTGEAGCVGGQDEEDAARAALQINRLVGVGQEVVALSPPLMQVVSVVCVCVCLLDLHLGVGE